MRFLATILIIILMVVSGSGIVYAQSDAVDVNLSVDTHPPDEDDDDDGSGDDAQPKPPKITDVEVNEGETSATISFETDDSETKTVISWGETNDYELGQIATLEYKEQHQGTITELDSNRHYYFKIEVMDRLGRSDEYTGEFMTESERDLLAPANPSSFEAQVRDDGVYLSWENPFDVDFDYVRIIRSEKIPSDPLAGEVVYEGSGESAIDEEAIRESGRHWYAIFARDEAGNYSSGVIIYVDIGEAGEVLEPGVGLPEFPDAPEETKEYIEGLSLLDFKFSQEGRRLYPVGDTIVFNPSKNLRIWIEKDKFPENLKTILVTLKTTEEKAFSFLLKSSEDDTIYEATLSPFNESIRYDLSIVVLDFKERLAKKFSGTLAAASIGSSVGGDTMNGETSYAGLLLSWLLIILGIILALKALIEKGRELAKQKYGKLNPKS